MSHRGVLVTRLSAIVETAAMDVLCTDKTGTITQKRLSLGDLCPPGGRSSEELMRLAALAYDAATQDPIDLLLFTNDFVTMSIATDRVSFSMKPDRWNIRTLMLTAGALATVILMPSFFVFFAGHNFLHIPIQKLQTPLFLIPVFSGQGNVYLVRERGRLWHSRPSR